MKFKKYKITSKKIEGFMLLTYTEGVLNAVLMQFKGRLTPLQWDSLRSNIPYEEENITALKSIGLECEEEKTNEKIGMFCRHFKQYTGIAYKVSAADSGKVKNVDVTDELLKVYFCSENFLFKAKYSISNYVKYYNELRIEATKKEVPGQKVFPDYWSAEYQKKLPAEDLPLYWRHLRALGWLPVKATAPGGLTVWQAPKK